MSYMIPRAGEDIPLIPIPEEARCQEAAPLSRGKYIACRRKATTIVYNSDGRGYYMCDPCADHNCRNRGGKLVTISPDSILKGEVKNG